MVYQTFKFILIRIGISFFLLFTAGFAVLFFFHEIALPGAGVGDWAIKWVLIIASLFFGFVVYGVFGDYQFMKAFQVVQDMDIHQAGDEAVQQFRKLMRFTESSYFLPRKGHRLRDRVVQEYANYLLNNGRDDEEALNVYLKAYLHDAGQTRFRNQVVSVLTSRENPTLKELELLILILKTGSGNDHEILNHLVPLFLTRKLFTSKTEWVFLKGLEENVDRSAEIVQFLLPMMIEKQRIDEFAVRFYLNALANAEPQYQKELVTLVSHSFLSNRFQMLDPDLHQQCGSMFESLEPDLRERMVRSFGEQNIAERWKQVRLFQPGDQEDLNRLQTQAGISTTGLENVKKGFSQIGFALLEPLKRSLFKIFEGLHWVGSVPTMFKLAGVVAIGAVLFFSLPADKRETLLSFLPGATSQQPPQPSQVVMPPLKIHTIQVAAVISQKEADKVLRKLKRKKVPGVYIVKTERKAGGNWYKIRIGKFASKTEAAQFASQLEFKKVIRSYFIITLGNPAASKKPDSPQKANPPPKAD